MHRRLRGAVLAGVLAGCASAGEDTQTVPTWSLAPEPDLIIGEDGTRESEFTRITALVPLPDGELLIADPGEPALQVFRESGEYRRSVGRQGEGPGEYRTISWVAVDGDTLVLYDFNLRRLLLLHLDGTPLSTVVPRPAGWPASVNAIARMPDGRWLVSAGMSRRTGLPEGVVRDTIGFGLLPADGQGDVEYFHHDPTGAMVGAAGTNIVTMGFAATFPSVRRLGSRVVVLRPETGQMTVYDASGALEAVRSLPMPKRPITASEVSRLRAEQLATAAPERRVVVEARFAPGAVPEYYPAFNAVLPDGEDTVWLEAWETPAPVSRRYSVVSIAGEWLAEITMPPDFQPLTIGPDWVLGIHRDADGVQRVMRYGLNRG